ncbi:MAG: alpha/beta hydrolase, partial [Clostridia bacterium]|nr:alpha/beta hydrolase [Clostridia bacterium]
RTEALKYGYYFAIPYAKLGLNVLVVDPRGHGLSDGEFNTVGFEESKDQVAWIKHLQQQFGIKSVILHGICIGAAGGMYALTSGNCPPIVDGFVTEGMFANFYQSMKNHLIEKKKPVFIMIDLIDAQMKKYTGHSMKFGPIDVIDKLQTPLLMLHSKKDPYSTAEYAQKLFDKAGSQHKDLVWFEHGDHSMLRITHTDQYDNAIAQFVSQIYNKEVQ